MKVGGGDVNVGDIASPIAECCFVTIASRFAFFPSGAVVAGLAYVVVWILDFARILFKAPAYWV